MALKALLAAAAAAAIAIGFVLPGPAADRDDARSQIAQIEVHR
jgi:hypothetical protein